MKPKVVLFDFYRTLLDIWTDEEDEDLWDRLARYLSYRGPAAEAKTLQASYFRLIQDSLDDSDEAHPEVDVGAVFQQVLRAAGRAGDRSDADELALLFRILSVQQFSLFPDVLPALERLRSAFRLGLVTDAQRVFLEPELRMSGIAGFMEVVIVSSDHRFRKPDPRMVAMALDKMHVAPQDALYVGDAAIRDMGAARAAGVTAVYLNRDGQAPRETEAERPDWIVADLQELCARLGA